MVSATFSRQQLRSAILVHSNWCLLSSEDSNWCLLSSIYTNSGIWGTFPVKNSQCFVLPVEIHYNWLMCMFNVLSGCFLFICLFFFFYSRLHVQLLLKNFLDLFIFCRHKNQFIKNADKQINIYSIVKVNLSDPHLLMMPTLEKLWKHLPFCLMQCLKVNHYQYIVQVAGTEF